MRASCVRGSVLALALWVGPASVGEAATLLVPEEYGSVLEAMDAAVAGDSVVVGPGVWSHRETRTISVNGLPFVVRANVFLKDGVSLLGAQGATLTVLESDGIDEGVASRLVVRPDQPRANGTVIQGFTLRGDSATVGVSNSTRGRVRLEDCVIEKCRSALFTNGDTEVRRVTFQLNVGSPGLASALHAELNSVILEDCTFEQNQGHVLRWDAIGSVLHLRVSRCRFVDNTGGPLVGPDGDTHATPLLTVEDCWFEGNSGALRGLCVRSWRCRGVIRRNVFLRNDLSGAGSSIVEMQSASTSAAMDFRRNIVYGCIVGDDALAVVARREVPGVFKQNIIAETVGASPPLFGTGPGQGCNVFWNNDGDGLPGYDWQSTDLLADPQFCDPGGGNFELRSTSPCADENNFSSCGPVGAFGVACGPAADVPHLIATVPEGLAVEVDGEEHPSEHLAVWEAGSTHSIATEALQSGGPLTRHLFSEWSDGGTISHDVEASTEFSSFVASFSTEHFLEVSADSAGTTTPDEWVPQSAVRQIEAVAAEGFGFNRWEGTGVGAYSGTENPAAVTVHTPIQQIAYFHDLTPQLTMIAGDNGSVTPETGSFARLSQVQILAVPDPGYVLVGWEGSGSGSYTGTDNPAMVTMGEPLSQTATFTNAIYALTMVAAGGGSVTPGDDAHASFTDVEIEAVPDPGHRFVQWKGQGDGSYTGTSNPATVTLNGPITQVAHFEPAAFSATLSLSDTDPYVHTGSPIGLGNVHLWVTCGSTERGLQSIALKTAGSLRPLAFLPAPGVAATGVGTVLASIDGCPDGPVRLGSFLVNSPGAGSLCLDASGTVTGLTITDCEGATYSWPENVGFVGVHTGGGSPCGGGTGCEEIDPFASPVGAPDIAAPPSATRLAGIFPNPFGSGTTIHFDVERAMDVRLTVFDVSGRQVRVLRHGSVPAGRHSVDWDGRDSSGRAVAGGVYFVRLTGDRMEQTEKVTVVRGRP